MAAKVNYVLYIDYKAGTGEPGYLYVSLKAKTLLEAIAEADKWSRIDIYLMRIMEKDGRSEIDQLAWRKQIYTAILCRRSSGWHLNTTEYSEQTHKVYRYYKTVDDRHYEWFDLAK